MSDWKYELDDGLIAFYEDGIQRSVDKVFDALNSAEKRVAKLEAEIVSLKEKRRWIPVSERLPEEGREVLVIFNGGYAVGRHLTNQSYLDNNLEFVKGDVWELGIEGIAFWAGEGYEDVTHWMPLPELPPEVKE